MTTWSWACTNAELAESDLDRRTAHTLDSILNAATLNAAALSDLATRRFFPSAARLLTRECGADILPTLLDRLNRRVRLFRLAVIFGAEKPERENLQPLTSEELLDRAARGDVLAALSLAANGTLHAHYATLTRQQKAAFGLSQLVAMWERRS